MPDAYVTITGTCAEPELRFTGSGKAVCSVSIAQRNSKKGPDGKWVDEDPTWWKVTCWEDMAENVAASITKGTRVTVTGTPRLRSYERSDGTKGYSLELTAEEFGVSLRWARVEVERRVREKDGVVKDTTPKVHRDTPAYDPDDVF